MILLNTKSILDCNEKETEVHFKEIEDLFETLSKMMITFASLKLAI